MIWLGLILGLVLASVGWTLMYSPIVERLKTIEQLNDRNRELLAEALKALKRCESENAWLTLELDRRDQVKTGYGPVAGTQ